MKITLNLKVCKFLVNYVKSRVGEGFDEIVFKGNPIIQRE